jgi:hypothetical protein
MITSSTVYFARLIQVQRVNPQITYRMDPNGILVRAGVDFDGDGKTVLCSLSNVAVKLAASAWPELRQGSELTIGCMTSALSKPNEAEDAQRRSPIGKDVELPVAAHPHEPIDDDSCQQCEYYVK